MRNQAQRREKKIYLFTVIRFPNIASRFKMTALINGILCKCPSRFCRVSLSRIMRVRCLISASPSPSSYIANTLVSSHCSSSSSCSPHSLVLDPAVLASLSPFLAPLLSSSTCILIPQASPSCLKLVSTLLICGSCKGSRHMLQEVQVNFLS